MKTKLYRYQKAGVRQIELFDGRVLLADEMGLGKTIQALFWVWNYMGPDAKVVVVCPASIKINWQREAAKHYNIRTEILSKVQPPGVGLPKCNFLIINYDILHGRKDQQESWLKLLYDWQPDVLICDEVHYIKTHGTKRTKAVELLAKVCPHVIMISGTPLTNRPAELYNVVNIINPLIFNSRTDYVWRYCNPRMTPWGLDVSGASHLDELHQTLTETCMIRRLKKDVLKDLPPKIRSVIPFELSAADRKEYLQAEREFVRWLWKVSPAKAKRAMNAEYLVKRGYLRRLIAKMKLGGGLIEWIENFMEESDEKLIFFGIHREFLRPIHERFKKYAVIVDGSITGRKRQNAFDAFTSSAKTRLLVGNIQAAGLGWNGQAACNVAFGEVPDVPGELIQAEDRAHRIGQTRGVVCHYLVAQDTIEEKLCQLVVDKQKVLSSVLDGANGQSTLDIRDRLDEAMLAKYGHTTKIPKDVKWIDFQDD